MCGEGEEGSKLQDREKKHLSWTSCLSAMPLDVCFYEIRLDTDVLIILEDFVSLLKQSDNSCALSEIFCFCVGINRSCGIYTSFQ